MATEAVFGNGRGVIFKSPDALSSPSVHGKTAGGFPEAALDAVLSNADWPKRTDDNIPVDTAAIAARLTKEVLENGSLRR